MTFRHFSFVFSHLFFVLAQVSCKKEVEAQPIANFTFDKEEYFEGDTIRLTNTSTNASTFKWKVPNGIQSEDTDVSFPIERLNLERELHFKLVAYSESEYKSDYIVKNIKVKVGSGQVVVGDAGFCGCQHTLFVDNVYIAKFFLPSWYEDSYKEFPACNDVGYPTFTLTTGIHTIRATTDYWSPWMTTIDIKRDECILVDLPY